MLQIYIRCKIKIKSTGQQGKTMKESMEVAKISCMESINKEQQDKISYSTNYIFTIVREKDK